MKENKDRKHAIPNVTENKGVTENRKRKYSQLSIEMVEIAYSDFILAASVVNGSKIESVGQDIGYTYDLSNEVDFNTGKTFSHEWESGGGL